MNKQLIKYLLCFILGFIVAIVGVVYAEIVAYSKDIIYEPSDSSFNVNNVEDALNNIYNTIGNNEYLGGNIIIANYLNETYVTSTSWQLREPTIFSNYYLEKTTNGMKVLKDGDYRIYYQAASDSNTNYAYIRILINNVEVASCSSIYARCDNRLIYYDSHFNEGDIIAIQGRGSSAAWGARVVVAIVKVNS